jgi:hypothetical protein
MSYALGPSPGVTSSRPRQPERVYIDISNHRLLILLHSPSSTGTTDTCHFCPFDRHDVDSFCPTALDRTFAHHDRGHAQPL